MKNRLFRKLKDIASEEFGVKIKEVKRETPLTFEELFGVEIKNMDKEQQKEGMQKIIEGMYEKTDAITTTDIINKFVEEGYHKTIWHKVVDGDLPKDDRSIRWLDKGNCYIEGYYDTDTEKFVIDCDNYFYKDEVIAWTELPEYKE